MITVVQTGVQQRIKETNPLAEFVPCNNHSLNLVGVHAASASVCAITFGTVYRCFYFFAASTHQWDVLEEELRREMLDCLDSLSQEIHHVSADVVDL